MQIFGLLSAAILVGIILLAFSALRRRRTQALLRLAPRLSCSFKETDPDVNAERWPLLPNGWRRQVRNVLRGEWERGTFLVFDYSYQFGRDKLSQTVVALSAGDRELPRCSIRPREGVMGFIHQLGTVVGMRRKVVFNTHPDFTKRYSVQAEDEAAVRALLNPEALAYCAHHPGWTVEIGPARLERIGSWILAYKARSYSTVFPLVKPEQLNAYIHQAQGIARLLLI